MAGPRMTDAENPQPRFGQVDFFTRNTSDG